MKYEALDITTLIKEFNNLKQTRIDDAIKISKQLSDSDRFINDVNFQGLIIYNLVFATAVTGHHEECAAYLQKLTSIVDKITVHAVMMESYLSMSCAYMMFNLFDNSLNSLMMILKIERLAEHKTNYTAIAYNNIASLYEELDEYDKALSYYLIADQYIDAAISKIECSITLQSFIPSNIAKIYSLLGQADIAYEYLKKSELKLSKQNTGVSNAKRNLHESYMFYYAATKDVDNMKASYLAARKLLLDNDNILSYLEMLSYYCKFCVALNLSYDYYIPYLEEIFDIVKNDRYFEKAITFFDMLADYYDKIGDEENLLITYEHLNHQTKLSEANTKQQMAISSEIRSSMVNSYTKNSLITEKNRQLQKLNVQLTSDKHRLENITHQLKTISQISQKIINTTNINDISKTVYDELLKYMSIDFLSLAINHKNDRQFIVEHCYGLGPKYQDQKLSYDNKNSLIIRAYHSEKTIKYDDFINTDMAELKIESENESDFQSLLFIPIYYNNDVVGVLSIHSKKAFAYGKFEMTFIQLLIPQLGIAIENARQSRILQREIEQHKRAQIKLENLNKALKLLSKRDSLTNLNNRRTFDDKFATLIRIARKNDKQVHLFMIDIDYFKLYNDTYGHLAGDEALIKIAQVLKPFFKKDKQTIARFGGEEFIGVDITCSAKQATEKAENIRKQIQSLNIQHKTLDFGCMTVSIGISSNAPDVNSTDMIAGADKALYFAKENGRNNVTHETLK